VKEVDGLAFILCALAVWRLTHLLAREDGPFDVVVKLRQALGDWTLGALMDCFYCLSLWLAMPFVPVLTKTPLPAIIIWLALSGVASLLFAISESQPRH
jgi:hypothetical protein